MLYWPLDVDPSLLLSMARGDVARYNWTNGSSYTRHLLLPPAASYFMVIIYSSTHRLPEMAEPSGLPFKALLLFFFRSVFRSDPGISR